MEVVLWIIGVHLLELLAFGAYLLIKKSLMLERTLVEQKEYINAISYIASQLTVSLSKIDERTYIEADPELEEVFDQIKEFKSVLEEISNK
jgi:predicted double-glycine peptidase